VIRVRILSLVSYAVLSSLAFAGALVAAPRAAQAQNVSDADRNAARTLFFQGVDLQNAGKFADALDKFTRAQSVVNAPTNLLHIAECQAALGRLVEAAESYRAVGRYSLPANAPQAFVAAQSQAQGELGQLEPRIPEVTIDVTPQNVPTLQVTIDEQPIPQALIGVSRAINPGQHKVVAQAAGYSREEKTIEVKERSKQKFALELKSNGAVTIMPAGSATAPPPPYDANQQQQAQQGQKIDKPQPYDPGKPPEYRSRMSLFLGPRLGAAIPAGKAPLSNGNTPDMADVSGAGVAYGAELAFRFARVLFVGAFIQGEQYGSPNQSSTSVNFNSTSVSALTAKDSSGGVGGVTFGWISNPDGVGVMLNGGVGRRWYSASTTLNNNPTTSKSAGTAVQLGVGIPIKLGRIFRLIPKMEVDFGSLKNDNTNKALTSGPAEAGYAVVFFGLSGDFDINLDKGPTPTTPASPPPASGSNGPGRF
jgi:hypothetical protein